MVQRIVEKNVEQGMLELDENQANVLNCIVDELPPLSREKYRRLALERLGEFLCTKQITLEKAYGLAWILADGWENFVSFWEKNTEKLTDDEKKQMCEEMGRLQYIDVYKRQMHCRPDKGEPLADPAHRYSHGNSPGALLPLSGGKLLLV